jgi:acetylglutamate kinase
VVTRGAPGPAPVVVKLGGRALDGPESAARLAVALRGLDAPAVVVHGGGAEVSDWSRRLGLEPRFVDGLRVTDAAALEVATAVLAGLANKRLVATFRAAGMDAVGLSALDGGVAEVERHPDAAALGEVGAVARIHAGLIVELLERGRLPVLASIGERGGALLNLNADDLAAALAPALGARALLLLSDTPGVKLGGRIVPALDRPGLAAALAGPDVTGGMRAKLAAARVALDGGVERVAIAAWEGSDTLAALLGDAAPGTTLTRGPAPATEASHV